MRLISWYVFFFFENQVTQNLVQMGVLGSQFFTAIPARWAPSPAGIHLHIGWSNSTYTMEIRGKFSRKSMCVCVCFYWGVGGRGPCFETHPSMSKWFINDLCAVIYKLNYPFYFGIITTPILQYISFSSVPFPFRCRIIDYNPCGASNPMSCFLGETELF